MEEHVVIIGSGPSAWTAAMYLARAQMKPCVFTGLTMGGVRGGQLMTTTEVENYPGFPQGIDGSLLMKAMEDQARRFNITVFDEDVVQLDLSKKPFFVKSNNQTVNAHAIVLATGAYAKRLDIPGDKEFWAKGVSACAVCDGALPIFRGKELAVVGGGDSACEEAIFLTKYASKVYLILRRDEFRASKVMAERVKHNSKITILTEKTVTQILGDQMIKEIVIEDVKTKKTENLPVGGLFYAIGHNPNTSLVQGQIDLDETGYAIVKPNSTETSVEGFFAAGDVSDKKYRQAVTAAGMGCMAALDAERWLASQGIHALES